MVTHQQNREIAVRIRHLGIVVQDLERTAEFYENVLGFKRLGDARTPGHYPGKALDLSDGEVNYSLLQPNPEIERSEWTYGAMGPTTSA
jgi:Lactoylglutathione lyase and related lyases